MKLIRRRVLAALTYNVYFRAKHIPGKQNIIADKLSGFKFQGALTVALWLKQSPVVVATHLLHI